METRAYDSMVDIVWYPHCPSLRRSHYRTLSSWNQMAIITSCLLQFVGIFSLAPFESTVQGKIVTHIYTYIYSKVLDRVENILSPFHPIAAHGNIS